MNFIDLFAGIGGFRLGMEQAGHKCLAFCEIDKFAKQTYKANFNTTNETEWNDISNISNEELKEFGKKHTVDIVCGGFPCQPFSIAGRREGFNDKRGNLFFEITRVSKIIRPRYLFLENVKGLLNHDKGKTFTSILCSLWELGYDVEWQVLNSKDFGVPQNRERVFIIGHLRGNSQSKIFPIERASTENIRKLEEITKGLSQGYRIYNPSGISTTLASQAGGLGAKTGLYFIDMTKNSGGLITKNARCLTARYNNGVTNRSGQSSGVYMSNYGNYKVRRLTPLECFRLQGFPDKHYYNAKKVGISDTQLYKQAGNAVTVPVIYEIAKRL